MVHNNWRTIPDLMRIILEFMQKKNYYKRDVKVMWKTMKNHLYSQCVSSERNVDYLCKCLCIHSCPMLCGLFEKKLKKTKLLEQFLNMSKKLELIFLVRV